MKMNKIKKQALITALLLSQTISLFPLAVLAAAGDIKMAGQPIITLNAPDGGTIAQRANTIQNNLDNALVASQDRSPAAVGIAYFQGTPVITLGGYQVITVTAADAQVAKTTPALLAQKWADSMRGALSNQASVNSYIGQLTGSSSSSHAPSGGNPSYQSAQNQPQYNGRPPGYDTYNNTNNNPPNNNYGGPQGGYPPQQQQQSFQPRNGGPQMQQGYQPPQGYPPQGGYAQQGYQPQGGPPQYRQGRVAYAQAGQVIPITLATSISTQVAQPGDLIQANITQNINLGDSAIPSGSVVLGQIASAEAGRRLARSGEVQIKFNRIRTPDGTETPISAHLVGGVEKYTQVGGANSDTFKGENTGNKVGSVAFRGLIGAGGGAALGTAVGAIAGQSGAGAGRGAWSGAAIGGGLGVADSLLLRKGTDVTIKSGTQMQLQLDAPASISGVVPAGGGYGGGGGYPNSGGSGGGGYAGGGSGPGYGY